MAEIEKIANRIQENLFTRQTFLQLFRYGCTGLLAAGTDLFFLYLFTHVFGMWYVASAACSYGLGLCVVFLLNKYWSFQKFSFTEWQLGKFLALMAVNYLLVIFLISFFTESLGLPYLTSKVAIITLQTTWNFFLYKYWVFQY